MCESPPGVMLRGVGGGVEGGADTTTGPALPAIGPLVEAAAEGGWAPFLLVCCCLREGRSSLRWSSLPARVMPRCLQTHTGGRAAARRQAAPGRRRGRLRCARTGAGPGAARNAKGGGNQAGTSLAACAPTYSPECIVPRTMRAGRGGSARRLGPGQQLIAVPRYQ